MSVYKGKLLYHLTELKNLSTIFKYGLLSRNEMIKRKLKFIDVADEKIIKFREENGLNDFIPFHLFPKNPFDGAVQKAHENKKFIYIVMHRNYAKYNKFKIIPRHPMSMEKLIIYDYKEGMNKIEWDILESKNYVNHECKEICMAECISEEAINTVYFQSIVVKDNDSKKEVYQLMHENNISKNIFIDVRYKYFL